MNVCLDEVNVFLQDLAPSCLSFRAGQRDQVPKCQRASQAQLSGLGSSCWLLLPWDGELTLMLEVLCDLVTT